MIPKNIKTISLGILSISMLLVYSCRENPKAEDTTATQPETVSPVEKKVTPAASTNDIALNPAHGQPGHRCDISVGAPLNSAPAPVKTTNQSSPLLNNSGTASPTGKLNPAHGQPGHRCDISVGAPLE